MKDISGTQLYINNAKIVISNNIQIHIIQLLYNNKYETKNRISKVDSTINNSKKEMKIEIAMNGHLENCICEKCHQAREMLKALRNI